MFDRLCRHCVGLKGDCVVIVCLKFDVTVDVVFLDHLFIFVSYLFCSFLGILPNQSGLKLDCNCNNKRHVIKGSKTNWNWLYLCCIHHLNLKSKLNYFKFSVSPHGFRSHLGAKDAGRSSSSPAVCWWFYPKIYLGSSSTNND